MAIRKDGKVYEAVVEALKEMGRDTSGIQVAAPHSGPDRWIISDGRVIGEYNHVSKRLILYSDIVNE